MTDPITCTPKRLPDHLIEPARAQAREINPANAPPPIVRTIATIADRPVPPYDVMTTTWWGAGGVHLTVGFMDNPTASLKAKILGHANAWGKRANVKFVESKDSPQVRINRGEGGYWSYMGTDILHVPAKEPTMNLQDFTDETEDSEFYRVVRHEFGHTLGMPHEHMRKELVALIDRKKAIRYYSLTQGWSKAETVAQVLTPLDDMDILKETKTDQLSIMCYHIPGSITKSGKPILGGTDIDENDYELVSLVYPMPSTVKQMREIA